MGEKKDYKKIIRTIIIVAIIVGITYFLIIRPYIKFKTYESTMKKAAERYFEINETRLPTGKRISTVKLSTLYNEKYIQEDFKSPLNGKYCSTSKSWVKVRKDGTNYKYYIYLDCGALKSNVDHEGPTIVLNGEDTMKVNKNEKFKDPGVKALVDNIDGKLDTKDVSIKGSVDTSKVGTYTITYTAFDSLNNQTDIKRTIKVVEVIKSTIKESTEIGMYKGRTVNNNYLQLSGNLFRIIGLDSDGNVRVTTEDTIGHVNYKGLESYLDKYYKSLSPESRKLIVKTKYCNDVLSVENLDTTECSSYTDKKNVFINSVIDYNRTKEDTTWMLTGIMDWLGNTLDEDNAYVARLFNVFNDSQIFTEPAKNINGVRPTLTIDGDALLKSGDGTQENPYILVGDVKSGKSGDLVNERFAGEYIQINNYKWRIVETNKEEPTRIISSDILRDSDGIEVTAENDGKSEDSYTYNPNESGNIGYYIKNKASEFITTKYLVSSTIKVPKYKDNIAYGKEIETKEYKTKLFAPDIFDLYNVLEHKDELMREYWVMNFTTDRYNYTYMADQGSYVTDTYSSATEKAIRVEAFLSKNATIVKGKGTYLDPYVISE